MIKFLVDFLSQPTVVLGLVAMIGLIAMKNSVSDVISGTFKTILGFLILSAGSNVIVGALIPFSSMFNSAFGMAGIVPEDNSLVAAVQVVLGFETPLIMLFSFLINLLLARITPFKYIFLTGHMMFSFAGTMAIVLDQMGIRGIAGETVMEEASCDARTPREAIMLGEGMIKRYRNHPRIKGCIAPHGTTTCGSSTLQEIHGVNHEYGVPFTLHVAEMDYEITYLKEQYGCTPIEYLDRLGILDSHTLCAHSIRLTEQDISLMAKSGSSVAHCIGSNTKAAKGVAPVSSMLEHGMTVGLGTDGPASGNTLDLFTQMRFCANFHKNETGDRSAFPAKDIVSMATIWGAGALGLDRLTGSLEPGKEADLVVVETDSPNMFPVYDPYSALVYSARADNVRHVFVAGRCLVKDKQLVAQDFRQIREDLQQKMNQTAFGGMGNGVLV